MTKTQEHTQKFATKLNELLHSTLDLSGEVQEAEAIGGVESNDGIYVSILFTGSFYGEYIYFMKTEFAEKITRTLLGAADSDEVGLEDIRSVLGELLNILSGNLANDLKSKSSILTITTPRLFKGRPVFPEVKTGKCSIQFTDGEIICYFYFDTMKLNIADSYREALEKIYQSYKKLLSAHQTIKSQQKDLIYAEKTAALGTLSSGVAHNINTPLGVIALTTSMVREKIKKSPEDGNLIMESLDKIDLTTTRISNIVKTLRDFSKALELNQLIKVEPTEFFTIATEALKNKLSIKARVELTSELKNNDQIEISKEEFTQCLEALFKNALEEFDLEKTNENWIKINLSENNDFLKIQISNSGNKISPEIVDSAFDPFFTKKNSTHAGLGLSLVKGIIEGHRGKVYLDNDQSHTSFVIELPLIKNN